MIIDSIRRMKEYESAYPFLKEVSRILETQPLATMPTGPYNPTNDKAIRYKVLEYDTQDKGVNGYEAHRVEADVQIILSGAERIDAALPEGLKPCKAYDAEHDIEFIDGQLMCSFIATASSFILLLPGEAHEPCLHAGSQSHIRKAVFKVRMSQQA